MNEPDERGPNDGPADVEQAAEPKITERNDINLNQNQQPDSPDIADENFEEDRIVKYIMVIGFHHKHGYQVDYCYPPLRPNGPVFSTPKKPIILPSCWKTLPLLCLPDGSHNYDSDTIYFTMPDTHIEDRETEGEDSEEQSSSMSGNCDGIKTIFGTACYRQIQADKLLNRTDDMTRIAVQKSVCVLSTKPLFGLIRSKLEMITHAYFEELDFSKVKILKLTYNNLNSLLARDYVKDNATFLGLSARQLIAQFGCNTLVLFKAMLLEKKILFYKSPVRDLCSTIMSMCSLFTGLLECGGLDYSTCDLQLSPNLLEALKLLTPSSKEDFDCDNTKASSEEGKVFFSPSKEEIVIISNTNCKDESLGKNVDLNDPAASDKDLLTKSGTCGPDQGNDGSQKSCQHDASGGTIDTGFEMVPDTKIDGVGSNDIDHQAAGPENLLADGSMNDDPHALKLCRLKPEETGLPLQIFTRGSFCLPYLSISYLDLLSDKRVRCFVIGATNFLFKQRKDLYDVIVDMEENTILVNDPNLKKCLSLTTEDLRFMDCLSRQVKVDAVSPKDDYNLIIHDISKWVGGDEWIRYHFRLYTLYMLKAARSQRNMDSFNSLFIKTWKQTTNNYKIWESSGKTSMLDPLQSKHPFSSATKGLNFSDMKLKLSYAVNSSEKGRMINQTINGIGKWSIWNNIANAAVAATSAATSTMAGTSSSSSEPVSTSSTLDKSSGLEYQNQK